MRLYEWPTTEELEEMNLDEADENKEEEQLMGEKKPEPLRNTLMKVNWKVLK